MEVHLEKDMTFNSIPLYIYLDFFSFLRDTDKVIQHIFLHTKRCYFHRKLFRDTPVDSWRGGGYGIYMGLAYFFKNFLINRRKRREILEDGKIFRKFHTSPPPLKVNWIPLLTQFLLCTITDQQTDTPSTHSRQNKGHNALRMRMRLN